MKVGDLVRDWNCPGALGWVGRHGVILKIGKLRPGIPDNSIDRSRHTQILVYWVNAPDPLANGEHWCESGWLEVIHGNR